MLPNSNYLSELMGAFGGNHQDTGQISHLSRGRLEAFTFGDAAQCAGPLSIKLLCSACEVLVVRNTKGEQWTAKPQAHRKQNIRVLYLGAQGP